MTGVVLPRFLAVRAALATKGSPAFWDPSGFGGRPLLGNPQAGLFYPPVWIAWAWGEPSTLGWLTVAHLAGAGLGTYSLARGQGLSPISAGVAGGCFQACPYLLGHFFEGHYPHVWAVCWYPWAFWAWGELDRGRLGPGMALPVILALTFLTGHPQEWYLLTLGLAAWGCLGPGGARAAGKRGGLWIAAIGLGLGLCGVELLPQLQAQAWMLRRSALALTEVTNYQVRLPNLLQVAHPFALGRPDGYFGLDNYWETVLSFGLMPLTLAVVGLAAPGNRARARRWGLLVALAVVFAAGRKLGLYALLYAVLPGMGRFRVPARSLFLASLGVSVLAGFGVEALRSGGRCPGFWPLVRGRLRWAFGSLIVVALGATLVPGGNGSRLARGLSQIAHEPSFWGVTLLGMAVVCFPRGRFASARGAGLMLGLLAVAEVGALAGELLLYGPASQFLGDDDVTRRLATLRATAAPASLVASTEAEFPDLRAVAHGWEKSNVNDGFQIQHAADLYEHLYPFLDPVRPPGWGTRPMDAAVTHFRGNVARRILDRMSVAFVVTGQPIPVLGLDVMASEGGATVARNPSALPRAYVVPGAVRAAGDETLGMSWLERIDPKAAVLLETADTLPEGPRQPYIKADWRADDPDRVAVTVVTEAPGWLVLTQTWYPGWSAWVNGRRTPVRRANLGQQAVALPVPGPQRVELRFGPPGLRAGLMLSVVSALAWGACLIGACRVARR